MERKTVLLLASYLARRASQSDNDATIRDGSPRAKVMMASADRDDEIIRKVEMQNIGVGLVRWRETQKKNGVQELWFGTYIY